MLRIFLMFTLFVSSLSLLSCASDESSTADQATADAQSEEIPSTPVEVNPTDDIREFWQQFRTAVAQQDKQAVAAMTEFPLRGADYMMPEGDGEKLGLMEAEFFDKYDQIFDPIIMQELMAITVQDLKFIVASEGNNLTKRTQVEPGKPIYTAFTSRSENVGTDYEQFVRMGFVFSYRDGVYKWIYLLRV